jgi:hypothetical protein
LAATSFKIVLLSIKVFIMPFIVECFYIKSRPNHATRPGFLGSCCIFWGYPVAGLKRSVKFIYLYLLIYTRPNPTEAFAAAWLGLYLYYMARAGPV